MELDGDFSWATTMGVLSSVSVCSVVDVLPQQPFVEQQPRPEGAMVEAVNVSLDKPGYQRNVSHE
jgi:hypothetical protein